MDVYREARHQYIGMSWAMTVVLKDMTEEHQSYLIHHSKFKYRAISSITSLKPL